MLALGQRYKFTILELQRLENISIEHFLEKYLHKCYIPEDHTDLHYLDDIKGFTKFQYF